MSKNLWLSAILFVLAGLVSVTAQQTNSVMPAPASKENPATQLAKQDEQIQGLKDEAAKLKQQVEKLIAQVGTRFGSPSSFDNIERRLKDLETKLDNMKRDMDRIDRRVHDLELHR